MHAAVPVSYTHLDVYKRQPVYRSRASRKTFRERQLAFPERLFSPVNWTFLTSAFLCVQTVERSFTKNNKMCIRDRL